MGGQCAWGSTHGGDTHEACGSKSHMRGKGFRAACGSSPVKLLYPRAMWSIVPQLLQVLCVFGLTLEDALNLPEAAGPRRVDVVELWCGVGSIVAAASATGYVVRKFDRHRVPGVTDQEGHASEDLLSSCGFMSAVRCVLAIRTGGLL